MALDPFVANPMGIPSPERYKYIDTYELTASSAIRTFSITDRWSEQDTEATVKHALMVEDQRPGWLSFLGLGPEEVRSTRIRSTHSSLLVATDSKEIRAQVEFGCGPDEVYAVEVYRDRIFGSFAFRSVPIEATPVVSGTVVTLGGTAMAGASVTLRTGGKRYNATANQVGGFGLRAKTISSGKAKLFVGRELIATVELKPGSPIRDLILKAKKATVVDRSGRRPSRRP